MPEPIGTSVRIRCADGVDLEGTLWEPAEAPTRVVVINCATATLATYYHRYARYLAERSMAALTWDYRGIGESRHGSLRRSTIHWRTWGEFDFDAVVQWTTDRFPSVPLSVVGHSWGGFLPGFAPASTAIESMVTVGAQHAYWPDYLRSERLGMLLRWHVLMPMITAAYGYFPGKRLGWLEDVPPHVVYEWALCRADMIGRFRDSTTLRARFAAVTSTIRAYGTTDDNFGTPAAIDRGLSYYTGATSERIELVPADLGYDTVGHFGLFHARHRDDFWRETADWLLAGQ